MNSVVVADSSPLNVMIRLGYVDVLVALYRQVVVPPEVFEELSAADTPGDVRTLIAARPTWLEIRSPAAMLPLMNLDAGERAAISLAVELKATLLIDERRGRREAVARGLAITGVVGILEASAGIGLLPDLRAAHTALLATDFHVQQSMLDQSLARHEFRNKA